MLKVLIAEDNLTIADLVQQILVDGGYEVCGVAGTVAEAVALGRRHKPDLAIIDLQLADGGLGFEIPAQLGTLGKLGVRYASGSFGRTRAFHQGTLIATSADASAAEPLACGLRAQARVGPELQGSGSPGETTRNHDDSVHLRTVRNVATAPAGFGLIGHE